MPDLFQRDMKLIGTHVALDIADHLTLIAICYSTSRSAIIQNLVQKYIDQYEVPKLVKMIAVKAVKEWDGNDFRSYVARVRKILVRKHLSETRIDQIILEMRRMYETNRR
jgi:hypothetical protein